MTVWEVVGAVLLYELLTCPVRWLAKRSYPWLKRLVLGGGK